MRGFAEYYKLGTLWKREVSRLHHVWWWSLMKTLSRKHKCSVRKTAEGLRNGDRLGLWHESRDKRRFMSMSETYNRRPRAIAHADRLAQAVALDMAAVGWRPTVENYLSRVTKGRIVEAVREAKGDTAAERVRPLKKADMAKTAEELLTGSGWLPEPLRTPGQTFLPGVEPVSLPDAEGEAQSAHDGGDPAMDQSSARDDPSELSTAATAVAAE